MLPMLGPAPPRDLIGKVVDIFLDPMTYVSYRSKLYYDMGIGLIGVIDLRAQNIGTLESIERTSVDYYATTRNLYLQYRKAAVNRGKPDVEDLPNFLSRSSKFSVGAYRDDQTNPGPCGHCVF